MSSKTKIVLTCEQEAYLRLHYPTDAVCDIAEYFHVSPPVISRIAKELGLKKSPSWRASQYNYRLVKHYSHERYRNIRV